jgi:hypothetical protein
MPILIALSINLRFLIQIAKIQAGPSTSRRFSFTHLSAAMVASLSVDVSNPDLTPDTRAFIVSSAKMHLSVSLAVCIVLCGPIHAINDISLAGSSSP